MQLRLWSFLLTLLIVLMVMPRVLAQNVGWGVTFSNLQNPTHVPFQNGKSSVATIKFTATINYVTISGYSPIPGSPPVVVAWIGDVVPGGGVSTTTVATDFSGIATSTPDVCTNETAEYSTFAIKGALICSTLLSGQSESFSFNLIFNSTGEYHLQANVIVFPCNGCQFPIPNFVPALEESGPFTISVTNQVDLAITVPSSVTVTIDDISQTVGSVDTTLTPGTTHTISVPQLTQLMTGTRLEFDHWSDGSTMTNRTMSLQDDTTLTAVYTTQYQLNLIGTPANATGAGWYDSGSTALFSVPTNFLFWTFQGWYENGVLTTSSNAGSVVMDAPHTLTSSWSLNLVLLLAICCVIAIIPIGLIFRKRRYNNVMSA